jgi:hypothetical protein
MAGIYPKNGPSKTSYSIGNVWELVGRPRQRWQEDVMEGFKNLKVKNWNETNKNRRF